MTARVCPHCQCDFLLEETLRAHLETCIHRSPEIMPDSEPRKGSMTATVTLEITDDVTGDPHMPKSTMTLYHDAEGTEQLEFNYAVQSEDPDEGRHLLEVWRGVLRNVLKTLDQNPIVEQTRRPAGSEPS